MRKRKDPLTLAMLSGKQHIGGGGGRRKLRRGGSWKVEIVREMGAGSRQRRRGKKNRIQGVFRIQDSWEKISRRGQNAGRRGGCRKKTGGNTCGEGRKGWGKMKLTLGRGQSWGSTHKQPNQTKKNPHTLGKRPGEERNQERATEAGKARKTYAGREKGRGAKGEIPGCGTG